jgi:hypothetical protein
LIRQRPLWSDFSDVISILERVLLIQENRLSGILLAHRMPLTELPGGKI